MKKILLCALILINATFGMDKEKAFPEEGLVEEADLEKDGTIWNFYNGERIKHILYPQIDILYKEHKKSIITRKMGSASADFYRENPTDEKSKIIDRYTKAVCWRLVKYRALGRPELASNLEHAERQIPINLNELVFIAQNIACMNPSENTDVKLELADLDDKPHSAQRAYLNALLANVKKTIENT